jgi:hypothetical protein
MIAFADAVQLLLWPEPVEPTPRPVYTEAQRARLRDAARGAGCRTLSQYWAEISPRRNKAPLSLAEVFPAGDEVTGLL